MTARGALQRDFITLLLASCVCVGATQWMTRKFKRLPDKKLLSEYVYLEVPSNSLMGCSQLCSTDPECLILSWQQAGLTCVFSSSEITGDSEVSFMLEDSVGWITLAAVRFPVFNVWRAGTRYNMSTMAEAETECRKRGMGLAAPSDLLLARSLGFDYCACSWLNDNTNGFVLQAPNWVCFGDYNDQVIDCSYNEANAWCLQTYMYF